MCAFNTPVQNSFSDKREPLPMHLRGKIPEPIYEHTAVFLARCHRVGVKVSLENPANSLMWLTKWIQSLLAMDEVSEKIRQYRWTQRAKWSNQLAQARGPSWPMSG